MEPVLRDRPELVEILDRIRGQIARKRAEQLESEQRWAEAGDAYLAIYRTFPNRSGSDEVLYNAAVCFEEAKLVGRAIQAHQILVQQFPRSRLIVKALYRQATAFAAIAQFDKAASRLETLARRYAGEELAREGLATAIVYRRALGQRKLVLRNTVGLREELRPQRWAARRPPRLRVGQ